MKNHPGKGDEGETGLADGARVRKDHPRLAACGDVDELNSLLGAARAFAAEASARELLESIQRDLMAVCTQLADPSSKGEGKARIAPDRLKELEKQIDRLCAGLPPLNNFVLPGGSKSAALLHVARAVCRRAERAAVALPAPALVLKYLNRLSDLLFVLARAENHLAGERQVNW